MCPRAKGRQQLRLRMGDGEGVGYAIGGARGAMLRGTTRVIGVTAPEISNRFTAGAISTIREGVAMAVPAAEQSGQTCESMVGEFKSTQQCNCAAKSTLTEQREHVDALGLARKFAKVH